MEQVLGNVGEACERFLDILELEPENVEIMIQLGFILTNNGEFNQALEMFERALQLDEKNPSLYSGIGITFLQQAKYEDARNAFLMANHLAPNDLEILKGLQMSDALCGETSLGLGVS